MIKLIAGLGNPGPKYQHTRHNAGFMLLDRYGSQQPMPASWRESNGALLCDGQSRTHKLFLVKPLKFMNLSGVPLRELMDFYKIEPGEILVAYDDIDLPLGSLRLKQGGGDGGHNGIGSIIDELGSREFARIKLGIGRPPRIPNVQAQPEDAVSNWVLGRFTASEQLEVENMLERGCRALDEILENGLISAQNKFNLIKSEPNI
ncbi:MAG: aminoacyl-tRNA hydrolase [Oligoflexia bacterium]|nr:aminoacyl-tRNA hydrolase [Oligoflexia bacterium]